MTQNLSVQVKKPHFMESVVSTALFLVLFMLVANVCVLMIARFSTEEACQEALVWAGKAAIDGKGKEDVMQAALAGVQNSASTSALISEPEFIEFKDYQRDGKRALRISTRSMARVPAPFLMPNAPLAPNGTVAVLRTYELEIAPQRAGRVGG